MDFNLILNEFSLCTYTVHIHTTYTVSYTVLHAINQQKHYGTQRFDVPVIEEIIYRLSVKDKVKELKRIQNLHQSRRSIQTILSDMNFGKRYIHLALLLYEVMAEMFEITKYHTDIYDLEMITEMIMRLRSKFTEYGDLRSEAHKRRNEVPSSTMTGTTTASAGAHSGAYPFGKKNTSKVASLASE